MKNSGITRQFRTPVSRGLEIYQGLRGHTSGYGVPTYVIDAPGGGGKIPLIPETDPAAIRVAGRDQSPRSRTVHSGKATGAQVV